MKKFKQKAQELTTDKPSHVFGVNNRFSQEDFLEG
jgi:hypothetical protein